MGVDDYEDEHDEDTEMSYPVKRKNSFLRMQSPKTSYISVRLSATSLEDARRAADSLKDNRQVIINLEKASDDVARRVVDFVSGVTYALDGSHEKVGEKVFLFAPSNTIVTVEDDSKPTEPRSSAFPFDKH
jgi:cell division inhibitor SepF